MASNEQRAKLVGHKPCYVKYSSGNWMFQWGNNEEREYCKVCGCPFPKDTHWAPLPYDTSRDACAELLRFVRERNRRGEFAIQLGLELAHLDFRPGSETMFFEFAAATPQQLCAAFDATFKDELEKIYE